MNEHKEHINPFSVTSPEDMSAENTFNLFVDVFSDFPKILDVGHTFLHGPRGSGKSMMFRYLMPDCQKICHNTSTDKLPFYGIYTRIKNTELKITELQRLEGKHASYILNEHFMTMHFAEIIFDSLLKDISIEDKKKENLEIIEELFSEFTMLLENCGWENKKKHDPFQSVSQGLKTMLAICSKLYSEVKIYFRKLAFQLGILPYQGALCSYLDFLLPVLRRIKTLPFLPCGPIFLLLDDADNLSVTQTKILNSWVFTRSSSDVSLKISTQLNYKTYHTVTGDTIDTPHDYSEINISTVYTASNKDNYKNRLREIVRKRLLLSNIDADPDSFFCLDEKQETAIQKIADDLKKKWSEGRGRGYRASDDVVRYARPDYIKSLSGTSKSGSSYKYAGFEQLVSISSGIVRYFLDASSDMYNEEKAKSPTSNITQISPVVQNKVVRAKAESFLFDELAKKKDDSDETVVDGEIKKLFNLIQGLGGIFRACLMSSRSERKVFSFAFSSPPSDDVRKILELGISYGYFHKSIIGKKDSIVGGKTRLYIFSRRLAPLYNLDPTGFAGYLFVDSAIIAEAMTKPDTLLRRVAKTDDIDSIVYPKQLRLF